jgi:hypothetical protein
VVEFFRPIDANLLVKVKTVRDNVLPKVLYRAQRSADTPAPDTLGVPGPPAGWRRAEPSGKPRPKAVIAEATDPLTTMEPFIEVERWFCRRWPGTRWPTDPGILAAYMDNGKRTNDSGHWRMIVHGHADPPDRSASTMLKLNPTSRFRTLGKRTWGSSTKKPYALRKRLPVSMSMPYPPSAK